MSDLLTYSLSVYFLFHLLCESDLLVRPRGWVLARMPSGVTYVAECPFCFTTWTGIVITLLTGVFNPAILFAAPVVNHLVGLTVAALRRNPPS